MNILERILQLLGAGKEEQKPKTVIDPLTSLFHQSVKDAMETLISVRPGVSSKKVKPEEFQLGAVAGETPRLRRILLHGEDDEGCILFSPQLIKSILVAAKPHHPQIYKSGSEEDIIAELTRMIADRLLRFFVIGDQTQAPANFCLQTYEPIPKEEVFTEYLESCESTRITVKEFGPLYLCLDSGRAKFLRSKMKSNEFCDALDKLEGENLDAGNKEGLAINIKNPSQFFLGTAFYPKCAVYEEKKMEAQVVQLLTTAKMPNALSGGTLEFCDQEYPVGFEFDSDDSASKGLIGFALEHFAFVFKDLLGDISWKEEGNINFDKTDPLFVCIIFKLRIQKTSLTVKVFFHQLLLNGLYDYCIPWFILRSMKNNLANLLLSALSFNIHAGDYLAGQAVSYYNILPASEYDPDCYPFIEFIHAIKKREARIILQLLAANIPAGRLTVASHADSVVRMQSESGAVEYGIVILHDRWSSLEKLRDPSSNRTIEYRDIRIDSMGSTLANGPGYIVQGLNQPDEPKKINREIMELLFKMMKEDRIELSARAKSLLTMSFRKADETKLQGELENLQKANFPWDTLLPQVEIFRAYIRKNGYTSEKILALLAFDFARKDIQSIVSKEVSQSNRSVLVKEIQRMEHLIKTGQKSYLLAIGARKKAAEYIRKAIQKKTEL